jgi:hypothetical protein
MKVIKPNSEDQIIEGVSVFLAGSIEMGKAEDWQAMIQEKFSGTSVTFLNPRRDNWDSSWKQRKSNPQFRHQVEWEIAKQEEADIIFMYFAPGTKSPISLLELGLFADTTKLIVCCPDSFWRKGNVEIVCEKFNIDEFNSLDRAIAELALKINNIKEWK